jgi:hypothetical protein
MKVKKYCWADSVLVHLSSIYLTLFYIEFRSTNLSKKKESAYIKIYFLNIFDMMNLIMRYIEKAYSQAVQFLLFDKFHTGPD